MRKSYMSLLVMALLVTLCTCSGEKDSDRATASVLKVGFAAEIITPELIETVWTDYNGNQRFDGDYLKPQGEPQDCASGSCLEPFEDTNGNGKFDAVWMAGFVEQTPIVSVHDDIWTRCVYFDNAKVRLAICTVDLIGFYRGEVEKIRAQLTERGIAIDYLVVNSTHNHNSPDTMGLWGPNILTSGTDPEYVNFVVETTANAVEDAIEAAVPVRMTIASGDTGEIETDFTQESHYRSGLAGDYRDPIITDQTLTIMKFDDLTTKATVGSVLHWDNHVEMHHQQDRALTSDYPEYIRSRLEEKLGGLAIYWTGPLGGLITPIDFKAPLLDETGEPVIEDGEPVETENRSWEQLRSYGTLIADYGIARLAEVAPLEQPVQLACRVAEFFLPVENNDLVLGFGMGVLSTTAYDEMGLPIADDVQILPGDRTFVLTETAYIKVGPLGILTLPGEVFPENWIGLPEGVNDAARRSDFYREDGGSHVEPYAIANVYRPLIKEDYALALGLANDSLGYIVPHEDYYTESFEGHYEETRCLGPNTEILLSEKIVEITATPLTGVQVVEPVSPVWP